MSVDLGVVRDLVEKDFLHHIEQDFGAHGCSAARVIMTTVRHIYQRYVDPSQCKGPIVVFQRIEGTTDEGGSPNKDWSSLEYRLDTGFTIELLPNAPGVLRRNGLELKSLSNGALVYMYEGGRDCFFTKGKRIEVPNYYGGATSIFASPTFSDLDAALDSYAKTHVRYARCPELKRAWSGTRRLFFVNKPEKRMRKSLETHLMSTFGEVAEVRPEQNVDETHPIDLRLEYRFESRTALIEIKWLGWSRGRKSNKGRKGSQGVRWGPSRALAGASQLAGYLEANKPYGKAGTTRGYLVVIDGRRKALKKGLHSISPRNGLYFATQEIKFRPEYHVDRRDFAPPKRMFAEPVFAVISS